ncbi:MAG: DUF4412 domain-containing protein [Desulfovibrionales bacterium]
MNKKGVVLALLGAALVMLAAQVQASEFSADMIQKVDGQSSTGKIYLKEGLMWYETKTPDGRVATIHRPDKNVMWVLMADEGMYMEMPYQPDPNLPQWTQTEQSRATLVGRETISGMETKKYEMKQNGRTITYWVNEEISFPVQVRSEDLFLQLANIEKGNVPDSLFEPPSGFEKMGMPMMNGNMGFSMPE